MGSVYWNKFYGVTLHHFLTVYVKYSLYIENFCNEIIALLPNIGFTFEMIAMIWRILHIYPMKWQNLFWKYCPTMSKIQNISNFRHFRPIITLFVKISLTGLTLTKKKNVLLLELHMSSNYYTTGFPQYCT